MRLRVSSDRMLDLAERFGIPRDSEGTWQQSVRYWWAYCLGSVMLAAFGVFLSIFAPASAWGPVSGVHGDVRRGVLLLAATTRPWSWKHVA